MKPAQYAQVANPKRKNRESLDSELAIERVPQSRFNDPAPTSLGHLASAQAIEFGQFGERGGA